MKVLFLGGVFSNVMEPGIINNTKSGAVQYAANKFQWSLIDGLSNIEDIDLEILSAPFVGTFPKEYKNIYINSHNEIIENEIKSSYVSFINIWGIRNYFRKASLIKKIADFVKLESEKKTIIVYSPHTPFLEAAVYAKSKDPRIKICLIVPDLPQFMNLNEKKTVAYKLLKKIDVKIFRKLSRKVDSFVLITEHMKDMLGVDNRPYLVVEGVIEDHLEILHNKKENTLKSVVYTGTLNKKFGIINLIKAFSKIETNNVVLKICGRGDASKEVIEYSKRDSRIIYLGQLNNEEAIKLQQEATLLVNPRPNNEDFTKYSFPFKTMEYLISGNPVLAFKLDGIPDEYDEILFYFENEDIDSMKSKMCEILNLSDEDRNEIGMKARRFIINNKSPKAVALKIFEMLEKV